MRRLMIAVALSGCAAKPPVVVSVPTPVACVRVDQVPVPPAPLAADAAPTHAVDALLLALAKLSEWKAYGAVAAPLLRNCSG